jgi:hypothetical protein
MKYSLLQMELPPMRRGSVVAAMGDSTVRG